MNAFVHWLEMDTAMMKVTPKARFFYEFHTAYTCEDSYVSLLYFSLLEKIYIEIHNLIESLIIFLKNSFGLKLDIFNLIFFKSSNLWIK